VTWNEAAKRKFTSLRKVPNDFAFFDVKDTGVNLTSSGITILIVLVTCISGLYCPNLVSVGSNIIK
jgi:hypothetical protein